MSGDLISRSALGICKCNPEAFGNKAYADGWNSAIAIIENAPAVDAVEVVRCRDCVYYEIHRPNVLENCERNGRLIPMLPDDFCSYGERGEENAAD